MAGLGRRTHYRKHLTDSVMYDLPEPKENERIAKVMATRGGNQFDVLVATSAPPPPPLPPIIATDHCDNNGSSSSSSSSRRRSRGGNDDEDDGNKDHDHHHDHRRGGAADTAAAEASIEEAASAEAAAAAAASAASIETARSSSSSSPQLPQLALLPTKFNKLVWLKRNDFVIVETGESHHHAADEHSSKNEVGGVRFMIAHILYKDQIKHLLRKGLWPLHDPNFATDFDGAGGDRKAIIFDEEDEHIRQSRDANADNNSVPTLTSDDNNSDELNDDFDDDDDNNDHEQHGKPLSSLAAIRRDDGIVYGTGYDDDDGGNNDALLFVNTNRIAAMTIQDSSDSEEEHGEE